MFSKLLLVVVTIGFLCAPMAVGRVILIDFGAHSQAGTPSAGGVWNTVPAGANQQVLKDVGGANTPYRLTTSDFVELTTSAALEKWKESGTWIDENASRDPLLTANSIPSPPGTVTISGFNQSEVFKIQLVASIPDNAFRNAVYTINNIYFHPPVPLSQPGVLNAKGAWMEKKVMIWEQIAPNSSGDFVLRVAPDADNQRGAINAMKIELLPEPGLGLIAGALATGLLQRTRR